MELAVNFNKEDIMIKHVLTEMRPKNRLGLYRVDIFQCSYDEICISLENTLYGHGHSVQFDIPIRMSIGYAIKVNKSSIGNDSGKASDLIDFLLTDTGSAFVRGLVQKLVFDHPKKSKTLGL